MKCAYLPSLPKTGKRKTHHEAPRTRQGQIYHPQAKCRPGTHYKQEAKKKRKPYAITTYGTTYEPRTLFYRARTRLMVHSQLQRICPERGNTKNSTSESPPTIQIGFPFSTHWLMSSALSPRPWAVLDFLGGGQEDFVHDTDQLPVVYHSAPQQLKTWNTKKCIQSSKKGNKMHFASNIRCRRHHSKRRLHFDRPSNVKSVIRGSPKFMTEVNLFDAFFETRHRNTVLLASLSPCRTSPAERRFTF